MMTRAYVPSVLAVVVSLAGCGLPSADRERAEYAAGQVEEQRKALSAAQSDFDKLAQDSFFGPFVRRENLAGSLKQAGAALDEAKKRYQAKVAPILEADKSEDVAKLRSELKPVSAEIGKARELIRKPAESRDRLAKAREEFQRRGKADASQLVSESGDLVGGMRVTLGKLEGSVDEAAKNHPERAADISAFAGQGAALYRQAQDSLDEAKSAAGEGSGDALGDHSMAVKHCSKHLILLVESTAGQLKELGTSYSKTLIDMRADFYLTVRRLSWSNRYDRPPLHPYDYRSRKVPEDVYDYFDKLNVDSLANYRRRGELSAALGRRRRRALESPCGLIPAWIGINGSTTRRNSGSRSFKKPISTSTPSSGTRSGKRPAGFPLARRSSTRTSTIWGWTSRPNPTGHSKTRRSPRRPRRAWLMSATRATAAGRATAAAGGAGAFSRLICSTT